MTKKPLLLAAVTLALLVIASTFWFTKKQALAPVVSEKPSVSTEEPIKLEPEKYLQHIELIPGNTDEVWYKIPELGVRIRLNKEFAKDLIYVYVHETPNVGEDWDAAYFSTKSLTNIDKGCSPGEGNPLGGLTKWKGNVQELAKTDIYFSSRLDSIIQIGDYYYMWTGPQATCWDPKKDNEIQNARSAEDYVGSGAKYVSDGIKTLQLITQN